MDLADDKGESVGLPRKDSLAHYVRSYLERQLGGRQYLASRPGHMLGQIPTTSIVRIGDLNNPEVLHRLMSTAMDALLLMDCFVLTSLMTTHLQTDLNAQHRLHAVIEGILRQVDRAVLIGALIVRNNGRAKEIVKTAVDAVNRALGNQEGTLNVVHTLVSHMKAEHVRLVKTVLLSTRTGQRRLTIAQTEGLIYRVARKLKEGQTFVFADLVKSLTQEQREQLPLFGCLEAMNRMCVHGACWLLTCPELPIPLSREMRYICATTSRDPTADIRAQYHAVSAVVDGPFEFQEGELSCMARGWFYSCPKNRSGDELGPSLQFSVWAVILAPSITHDETT